MSHDDRPEREDEPRVTDKRRIDPETGEARPAAPTGAAGGSPQKSHRQGIDDEGHIGDADRALLDAEAERLGAESDEVRAQLELVQQESAERLADLQRLTAEFANYRMRVERDREANAEAARVDVIQKLLPVLDDLDLAEAHGDVAAGPIALIVNKLRTALAGLGLERVGAVGDVFDPNVHEAIAQVPTPGAEGMTVLDVVAVGYKVGARLVRPAKVAVAVPAA